MISTRLTSKFDLKVPIVLAPINQIADARLARAVTRAGGLGLLAPEFGIVSLQATEGGEPDSADPAIDSYFEQCDVVLLGPGMMDEDNARNLAVRTIGRSGPGAVTGNS